MGHGRAMTAAEVVAKWRGVELSERAASHEHFIDLCRLLGQPTPADVDKTGAEYTFEKSVAVTGAASKGSKGAGGFADVWWRGKFAWEYKRKGKYKNLDEAYRQLCQYREALENPPLLVVSDIGRTEIHTNFTGTAKQIHVIELEELDRAENLDLLRRIFTEPASLRPEVTTATVTAEAAARIGEIAQSLRERGHEPHAAAHFLMKCMFCLFAEDVGLLPKELFTTLLKQWHGRSVELRDILTELFGKMRSGGAFGVESIAWFNGGLFDEAEALELTEGEAQILLQAALQDWSSVEPAIFGTLFERSLDPSKRAQIGAHYTSREDIMLVIEPVIMRPLRRRWAEVRGACDELMSKRDQAAAIQQQRRLKKGERGAGWYVKKIEEGLQGFLHDLGEVRVLDPACGSGNFLYVAIQELLYLEKEVIRYGADAGVGLLPTVRPTQLHGIEINPYAAELAQVVIWIGYLQWMRENGFNAPRDPILEPLQTIECRDAILAWADEEGQAIAAWREGAVCQGPAEWPTADYIVGNPPFLGAKLFRKNGLEDAYIENVQRSFDLPRTVDLCCYWFELGSSAIVRDSRVRVGLLATQGIRGGDNRRVLERVKEHGDIFMAWSDKDWILDGAAVHVSIIGFDSGQEQTRELNGERTAEEINANLRAGINTGEAEGLVENRGISFMAGIKVGAFDIDWETAKTLLGQPNPQNTSNLDVLHPWYNGLDVTRRAQGNWIIDFRTEEDIAIAALYEAPFAYVEREVKPSRVKNKQARRARLWWLHGDVGRRVREKVLSKEKYIGTPRVTKHRLFAWLDKEVLPDAQLIVFARSDDYFFGVLHSSVHELWARRMGTQLREAESGFRYTPTTCFETFALPWRPGAEAVGSNAYERIAAAARELNELRERWLNPPEWIGEVAAAVDEEEDFSGVEAAARVLLRESAIMARAARDGRLKKRTLTNLYNERPTWLRLAHRRLDEAVLGAYKEVDAAGGWEASWAAVWEATGAGQALAEGDAGAGSRAAVEERVLGNLLRLNGERGGGEKS